MESSEHALVIHLHDKPYVEVDVHQNVGVVHANWLNIKINTFELTVFCRTPTELSDLVHQLSRQLMRDLFANAYKEIKHADNIRRELSEDASIQDMSIPPTNSDLQTTIQEIGAGAFTFANSG